MVYFVLVKNSIHFTFVRAFACKSKALISKAFVMYVRMLIFAPNIGNADQSLLDGVSDDVMLDVDVAYPSSRLHPGYFP